MPASDSHSNQRYTSFREFYPFYLSEHSNAVCRRLHFVGSSLALCWWVAAGVMRQPWFVLYGLITVYTLAWVGHFVFEKNKPASFKQPLYSAMGDWVMWWQHLTGKIKF